MILSNPGGTTLNKEDSWYMAWKLPLHLPTPNDIQSRALTSNIYIYWITNQA